jgi:predicted ATPase
MPGNPFKPSAGSTPPELIGRQPILDGIGEAIADGPGAPGRLSIFTGARGVGKTVMLNEVEDRFEKEGWRKVSVTASPGFVREVFGRVSGLLADESPPPKGRITGVTGPGGVGVQLQRNHEPQPELRQTIEGLLDEMGPRGSGLLVTVDEVHAARPSELRELAVISQHLVREDRQFALAMAGLGGAVSDLLNDDVLTFMRRADRHELGSLVIDDVEDALRSTIIENDRSIDEAACRRAAEATRGYPFLVQLVGHQVWRSTSAEHMTMSSVDRGITAALKRLRTLVHEPALNDLSDKDREFVAAMAVDQGQSRIADVAERMGRSPQYVNTYRSRLISSGVIETTTRGRVRFAVPYLRDTVLELIDEGAL